MTVDELLGRITSQELTEWQVFFEMQEDELERRHKSAQRDARGPSERPSIGDAQGRADAIAEARKAQGLE